MAALINTRAATIKQENYAIPKRLSRLILILMMAGDDWVTYQLIGMLNHAVSGMVNVGELNYLTLLMTLLVKEFENKSMLQKA